MVRFSHYLILDGEQIDEGGVESRGDCFGSQWEGCGEVGGLALGSDMW